MKLTTREIELIDGMIEVQDRHAKQCQEMIKREGGNVVMATKQLGWDTERINLLTRIKQELLK